MGNEGRRSRKLSVARELLLLAATVDALRQAADRDLVPSKRENHHDFAFAMAGSLMVLRDRIRLLERILMGSTCPSVILCAANQADSSEEGPGIVNEWSAEEEMRRLEAEWRGARQRRDLARQEQRPDSFIRLKKPDPGRSN